MFILSKGVEVATADVQEGTDRGCCGSENHNIDNRRKYDDSSVLDTNHPGRRCCVLDARCLGIQEPLVIVRNENADGETAKNVEN